MATLDQIFSQANMDKLNGALNSPLMTLGSNMLANSGFQPGATGASRMGTALSATQQQVMQQQQAQQMAQYRNSLAQQQQAQLQMQQAKAQEAAQFKANMQNPEFMKSLPPEVQQWAQAGAGPEQIMDLWGKAQDLQAKQAQLASQQNYQQQRLDLTRQGQAQSAAQAQQRMDIEQANRGAGKTPTPSQIIEEPTADGKFQKHIFDAAIGGYKPYGAPYQKSASMLEQLLGGAGGAGTAVPDTTPGAVDQAVNQLTPAAPMVGAGSLKNATPTPAPQQAGAPVQIKTAADFDKLPSGALFITPDGKVKQKP